MGLRGWLTIGDVKGLTGGHASGDALVPEPQIPPAAREAIRLLANAATSPMKLLISGGIGRGKSTAAATARDTLRRAGLTVLTRPPRAGDPPDAALVVDDAHLSSEPDLRDLTERVADPGLDRRRRSRIPRSSYGNSPSPSNVTDHAYPWVRYRSLSTCWPPPRACHSWCVQ